MLGVFEGNVLITKFEIFFHWKTLLHGLCKSLKMVTFYRKTSFSTKMRRHKDSVLHRGHQPGCGRYS